MKIHKYINVYIIYTRKELILVGLYLADILGIFVKYDFAKSVSKLKIWTDLFFFLLNLIFDNKVSQASFTLWCIWAFCDQWENWKYLLPHGWQRLERTSWKEKSRNVSMIILCKISFCGWQASKNASLVELFFYYFYYFEILFQIHTTKFCNN